MSPEQGHDGIKEELGRLWVAGHATQAEKPGGGGGREVSEEEILVRDILSYLVCVGVTLCCKSSCVVLAVRTETGNEAWSSG